MIDFFWLLGGALAGLFRSHAAREAETAFLRQQLLVLKRSAPARPRLRNTDRLIFVWLYRLVPSLLGAAVIFKPETLVRWHRSGSRLYWRWKSRRRRAGRPTVPAEIRELVRYRLTLRDLSEIMLLRKFTVSHECIRRWEAKLQPLMGDALRKRRHGRGRRSGQSWLWLLKISSDLAQMLE